MDDLISRQAAIDALEELKELDYELYIRTGYSHLMEDHWDFVIKRYNEAIKETPCTPQKTGRWIYKERNILINTGRVSYGENGAVQEKRWAKVKKPYCSECGWYENSEYEATPYCPNCGAKMEGEET